MRLVEIYFYFFVVKNHTMRGVVKNGDLHSVKLKYISAGIVSRITKGHRFYA